MSEATAQSVVRRRLIGRVVSDKMNKTVTVLVERRVKAPLIGKIVTAALEAEFGPSFTRSKGFDKMVGTISDTIEANPDLRRQSLSLASQYMEKGIKVEPSKKVNDDKKN